MLGVLAFLALQSAPVPAETDALAAFVRLFWDADRVAVVRIADVTAVPVVGQRGPHYARPRWSIDVATMTVERTLIGPEEEEEDVHATLTTKWSGQRDRDPLIQGERAIVFLYDESRLVGLTHEDARRALEAHTSAQVRPASWCGIWYIDSTTGEVRIPQELRRATDTTAPTLPVDEAELVTEIERWVERSLPILSADLVTTGPSPWGIELAASGEYAGSERGRIDPLLASELIDEVRSWRSWPRRVGRSLSPCDGGVAFTLYERHGPHRVYVQRSSREQEPDEVRARMDEALALWNRLPGARRPSWH